MTYPEPFVAKVLLVTSALDRAGVPYAIGGALAYGYHAEPRGTSDIDINVFLSDADARPVIVDLGTIGVAAGEQEIATAIRTGQVRLQLEGTFVDLFFANHQFHDSCASRSSVVRFDGGAIRILSAEDLVVFKALFNRGKDWLDIEQVLRTQAKSFDSEYVLSWLDEMLGPSDSVRIRIAELLARAGPH